MLLLSLGCTDSGDATSADGESAIQSRDERATHRDAGVWFVDRAQQLGIDFTYQSGHREHPLFPEIMGGGVALFDMDADGDLDLYFVQGGRLGRQDREAANRLFRNEGKQGFVDVSAGSGADDSGYGMGAAAGDVDSDGDVDLYVTNVGVNRLLLNDGRGRFTTAQQDASTEAAQWSTSAAFLDFDRDGDLDLFTANYVVWALSKDLACSNRAGVRDYCNPTSYNAPLPDSLFRNRGDGSFEDVSAEAGLRAAFGNGLGVVPGDFDNDGWVDVFVANDGDPNQLWINQADGRFVDEALARGCSVDQAGNAKAGMGTCAADIDADDDLDILVVNLVAQADSLFRNEGAYFVDATARVGLGASTRARTRFGVGWVDFDHDGLLDIFQANGRVTLPDGFRGGSMGGDPFAEVNTLLVGSVGAEPSEVRYTSSPDKVVGTTRTSRAAGFGDLDGDGDLDVVVVNRDAPVEVLINQAPKQGSWLSVQALNRFGSDALGAVVRIKTDAALYRREINSAYSYLAANDARAHFSMSPKAHINSVEVAWPDGTVEAFPSFAWDQWVVLKQGEGIRRP